MLYELHVQTFLRSGKSLQDLTNEFGIKTTFHETKNLVILNYDQIDSHKFKFHPIVRECRGLTLELKTWDCKAVGFKRFFNLGEDQESEAFFNWNEVYCQEKCDGSLILLYKYNGEICVNTRGSFAQGNPHPEFDFTWEQLFWMTGVSREEVEVHLKDFETWVFELCSPYNKVVRKYEKPMAYLLGGFRNDIPNKEIGQTWLDMLAENIRAKRPLVYKVRRPDDLLDLIKMEAEKESVFEGFVVKDWNNHRIKCKNPLYVAMHHLKGNNEFSPKYVVPFILKNLDSDDEDEVMKAFPEFLDKYLEYKNLIKKFYNEMFSVWDQIKDIQNQKDFALKLLELCPKNKSIVSSLLFNVRKTKSEPQVQWNKEAESLIIKFLER